VLEGPAATGDERRPGIAERARRVEAAKAVARTCFLRVNGGGEQAHGVGQAGPRVDRAGDARVDGPQAGPLGQFADDWLEPAVLRPGHEGANDGQLVRLAG